MREDVDESAHGAWPSPISAALVAAGGNKIEGVAVAGGQAWWVETRPADKGRGVLVSCLVDAEGRPLDKPVDRLPEPWSVRSRVHEYGGGAWWLGRQHVYFVNAADQRIYRIPQVGSTTEAGADEDAATGAASDVQPEPLAPDAPEGEEWRFADGREHPDGRLVIAVRELHRRDRTDSPRHQEPVNEIVAIPLDGSDITVLVGGPDFVSDPRPAPDGRRLSWIEWNHPNMPWNATSLRVADLMSDDEGPTLGEPVVVAEDHAVIGADWTADGALVYSDDRDGRWNLRRWAAGDQSAALTILTNGEIGGAAWNFGTRRWAELADGRLAAVVTTDAVDSLVVLQPDGRIRTVDGYTSDPDVGSDVPVLIKALAPLPSPDHPGVVTVSATATSLPSIETVDVRSGTREAIRPADDVGVDRRWLARPEAMWFESSGRPTQAFLYRPPAQATGTDPELGPPPLIVVGHGGPTSHSDPALNLKIQYWASRGFAVVDVNYGGSTGFGTAYRNRLHEAWGIVDVEDCVNAALHLANAGVVDGSRLAIRGSSSGGLTVMAALLACDRFAAGVSLYGVTDLMAMLDDTHKFESRYFDWLIGPYPAQADRYRQRSPINRVSEITTPMLLLQGTDDRIVPPAQSEAVAAALDANGVDHLYVPFEGEPHGFRQADSIVRSLELELWFYGRVFGFTPADDVDPGPAPPEGSTGRGLGIDRD